MVIGFHQFDAEAALSAVMRTMRAASIVAGAMLLIASARASDDWFAAADRVQSQLILEESQVDERAEVTPAAFEQPIEVEPECDDVIACGAAVDCGDAVGAATSSRGRWILFPEMTVLVPDYTDSTYRAKRSAFAGPRLTLGYEEANGFGIRGRAWGFDGVTGAYQGQLPSTIDAHQLLFSGARLDLDFYKRVQFSKGDFAFGVGLTGAKMTIHERYWGSSTGYLYGYSYGDYVHYYNYQSAYPTLYQYQHEGLAQIEGSNRQITPIVSSSYYSYYQQYLVETQFWGNGYIKNRGIGVDLMAEGTYRLMEYSQDVWALFGRGRIASLVGTWEARPSSNRGWGDANMTLGEATVGIQYTRKFHYADVTALCGFEAQLWDLQIADQVTLVGLTTGLGATW